MLHQSKIAEVPPAEPINQKPGSSGEVPCNPVRMVCDLGEAQAFSENYKGLHVPVLAAFGGGPLHTCRLYGSWDVKRAVSEKSDVLVRSIRRLSAKDEPDEWDDLTFQFGANAFLYADSFKVVGFASSPEEAKRLVTEFAKTYTRPPEPSGGAFHLINLGSQRAMECVIVHLPAESILSPETFDLHYGEHAWGWHEQFVEKLSASRSGLSILQGPPGTGKTSYLRHLMGVLDETHRFYFIPASAMGILSEPAFMGFWADQRRRHDQKSFVVILEDSDAALMCRGSDNRDQVNAILNLSDGMLADFLRLQILCTINCGTADVDPALLRPGRLLCHRVFARLDYPHAVRLAEKIGRVLTVAPDYSLAEVFAGHEAEQLDRPRIGFAV